MSTESGQATSEAARIIEFGPFRYDTVRREVSDGKGAIRIGSRALELLDTLLESPGRLYSRAELEARVWPHSVVEETSLRVHMSALRRALGDGQAGTRFIANVPGRGYAFVAEVTTAAASSPRRPVPERFGSTRGLPARLIQPIGRDQAIAHLDGLCARERLVSIVGAGGMGKTTVAAAVAAQRSGRYAHGIAFVDLCGLSDPALLGTELAQALGLGQAQDTDQPGIEALLRDKHLLIVLDNCEHVIDAAAATVDRLLRSCPAVHFIATSREPLEIEAEQVFRLPPLDLPDTDEMLAPAALLDYASIQLFVERAQAICDAFELTEDNAGAVQQLCHALDGIPLAIELAAARVDMLGVHGLLLRLENAFELLTRGHRTALSRHRTLHAVLSWSYELLDDAERLVLQRLSVFSSAFDLDAAATLAAGPDLTEERAIECVLSLCAKSLIALVPSGGSALRHRLLYITRLFARKQLAAGSDAPIIHRRHALLMRDGLLAAQAAGQDMSHYRWTLAAEAAIPDLRAAIEWAIDDGNDLALGIEITVEAMWTFFDAGLFDEFRRRSITALERAAHAGVQGSRLEFKLQLALTFSGSMTWGSPGQQRVLSKTRALAAEMATTDDRIEALYGLCVSAYAHGDYRHSLACCDEIRELAQHDLAPLSIALADRLAALNRHALGEHEAAEQLAERVLALRGARIGRRFLSEVPFEVSMGIQLARIQWLRGEFRRAWASLHDALASAADAHVSAHCQVLGLAAIPIAMWRGDLATAGRWTQELRERATRSSQPYWQAFAQAYRELLASPTSPPSDATLQRLKQGAPLADITSTLAPAWLGAATIARVERGEVGWCAPEVQRLAALDSLEARRTGTRRQCLDRLMMALDLSDAQGANFWSMRIATSLCRVTSARDPEQAVAHDRLRRLLASLDDGSAVPELQQARQAVDGLVLRGQSCS